MASLIERSRIEFQHGNCLSSNGLPTIERPKNGRRLQKVRKEESITRLINNFLKPSIKGLNNEFLPNNDYPSLFEQLVRTLDSLSRRGCTIKFPKETKISSWLGQTMTVCQHNKDGSVTEYNEWLSAPGQENYFISGKTIINFSPVLLYP